MGTTQSQNSASIPKHELKTEELKEIQFKLHIAIDFGTDGCALAFAYKGKVTTYNRFRGQQTNSNKRATLKKKTKTQLILNAKNEVTCFGNAAKFSYCNLSENEKQEKKFFERFKMKLYEKHLSREKPDDQKIDTEQHLTAINGQRVKSEIVFIAAFRELQRVAKSYIGRIARNETITDDEIQWIVTVPAIWSQKAKNKMKLWMIKAGLVNPRILNQCMIVYEPDCASLSIKLQFQKGYKHLSKKSQGINFCVDDIKCEADQIDDSESEKGFHADDLYLLIDAGGGTVDIACHKIRDDGCVEEMVHPTGDKWGSCYIDDLFIVLLEDIFSKQWMDEYKARDPAGFIEILDYFQTAKESFYINSSADTHGVLLPNGFMDFLDAKCHKHESPGVLIKSYAKNRSLVCFERLFSKQIKEDKATVEGDLPTICQFYLKKQKDYDQDDESDSNCDDEGEFSEYLMMDTKIWQCLFDSKIDLIISHVTELFNKKSMQQCKYLGLVGGFACSPYFQKRIKNTFGIYGSYEHTKKIIIPKNPMLAVVEGAAWMAITKYYIRARKLPLTYGIRVCLRKDRAEHVGMSQDYIKQHTEFDGKIDGYFAILARKNDRILINEVRTYISYRRTKDTTVQILQSKEREPVTYKDGSQLGQLIVPFFDADKSIITEFHFYDAMFKVYAYAKNAPNAKKSVILRFPN